MNTPQADIDWAILVEKAAYESGEKEKYLEYLNWEPMSERVETGNADRIRSGCILTGIFVRSKENS